MLVQGKSVVRLKGGCPSVFSRCSSELLALDAAGCEAELVPGVSSALAAPLFSGKPVLHHALVGDSFLRQACTCKHAMTMADREISKSLETALIIAFRVGDHHACSAWRRADVCT